MVNPGTFVWFKPIRAQTGSIFSKGDFYAFSRYASCFHALGGASESCAVRIFELHSTRCVKEVQFHLILVVHSAPLFHVLPKPVAICWLCLFSFLRVESKPLFIYRECWRETKRKGNTGTELPPKCLLGLSNWRSITNSHKQMYQ